MFVMVAVAHIRIIYFLSSSPWSACLNVVSSHGDCMPDNGINCFRSGLMLQYFSAPDSFLCCSERGESCILL